MSNKITHEMNWNDINLRFAMKNGDYCVCKVNRSYSNAGYLTGMYQDGNILDVNVIDDPDLFNSDWALLSDVSTEFLPLGVNRYEELKNIN